jgi:hypothetical protein
MRDIRKFCPYNLQLTRQEPGTIALASVNAGYVSFLSCRGLSLRYISSNHEVQMLFATQNMTSSKFDGNALDLRN